MGLYITAFIDGLLEVGPKLFAFSVHFVELSKQGLDVFLSDAKIVRNLLREAHTCRLSNKPESPSKKTPIHPFP
jgi:hypothetical protein